jgi:hypothetical protein
LYACDHCGRTTSPATSSNLSTERVIRSGRVPHASTPLRRGHRSSQRTHVCLWTSVWTSPAKMKRPTELPQGGQGRRSRGGHVWPPDLDGPVTFTDTMDEAGPLRPAWKRLCPCPRRSRRQGRVFRRRPTAVWGSGSHPVQVCDYFCGHSPGGLERVDIAGRAPVLHRSLVPLSAGGQRGLVEEVQIIMGARQRAE